MADSAALTYASVRSPCWRKWPRRAPGSTGSLWPVRFLPKAASIGYGHVVPFFLGGLLGFYGAALFSLCLLAWGAGLHKRFKQHLFLAANILLLLMGISYLVRAYFGTKIQ